MRKSPENVNPGFGYAVIPAKAGIHEHEVDGLGDSPSALGCLGFPPSRE
jgi:hypothetical protein